MKFTDTFNRGDVFKLAGLLILLLILVSLVWVSQGVTSQQVVAESQAATMTSDRLAQAGTPTEQVEPATPSSGDVPGEGDDTTSLPVLPESALVMEYKAVEGVLYTSDGRSVYRLSADMRVWVPIVPDDLISKLGDRVPQIDPSGYWVIMSSDGKERYRWDGETAAWVPLVSGGTPSPTPGSDQAGATQTAVAQEVPAQATSVPQATEAAAAIPTEKTELVTDVPMPTPGLPKTHILQSGEFVYCIARRYNVNPDELLRLNGLSYNSIVFRGMKLKIPQTGHPFPGSNSLRDHPATCRVKKGDTIYSIACQFGDAYPYAIAYANQLSSPYKLKVGQEILIP